MEGGGRTRRIDACLVDARCEVSEQLPGRRVTFAWLGTTTWVSSMNIRAVPTPPRDKLEATLNPVIEYNSIRYSEMTVGLAVARAAGR